MECRECHTSYSYPGKVFYTTTDGKCISCGRPIFLSLSEIKSKVRVSRVKMSPLELEFLLHCYVCPEAHPRAHAPALEEAADKFMGEKIIESTDTNRGYKTTEKGEVWIRMILSTPKPEAVWLDAKGNIVN